MGLPKAVQAIGDAAERQAEELGMKPGSKPAQQAEPAAPAETTQKVDPENYEERFKRYKASTDQTIADLRQTLADTQATLAQVQQQNQQLMAQQATVQPAAPAPASSQQPADPKDEEAAYKAWHDNLPQNMKDEYTDDYKRDMYYFLKTMPGQQAAAAPADNLHELETKVDSLMQNQEKTQTQLYEEAMDDAYPDDAWITMTREPEWSTFCAQAVSPVDQRTYGEIVKQGNEQHVAQTVIWVLQQYEQYKTGLAGQASTEDAQVNTMEGMITPEGGAGGDAMTEISANAETYTVSQVNQFYQDMTKGKYTAEEFTAIEDSIKRAQQAGKIIQG